MGSPEDASVGVGNKSAHSDTQTTSVEARTKISTNKERIALLFVLFDAGIQNPVANSELIT